MADTYYRVVSTGSLKNIYVTNQPGLTNYTKGWPTDAELNTAIVTIRLYNDTFIPPNKSYLFTCAGNTTFNDTDKGDISGITTMGCGFGGCTNLESIDMSTGNTNNVADIIDLFFNCVNLRSVTFGTKNFSNVTSMFRTFYMCSSLEEVDLSNCTFSNKLVTMEQAFIDMDALKTIKFNEKSDYSGVQTLYEAFKNDASLKNVIGAKYWNLSSCTNFNEMFMNCSALEMLNIRYGKTPSLRTATSMFEGCINLNPLGFRFDMNNATDIQRMFYNCKQLRDAYTDPHTDWSLYNITQETSKHMFYLCNNFRFVVATDQGRSVWKANNRSYEEGYFSSDPGYEISDAYLKDGNIGRKQSIKIKDNNTYNNLDGIYVKIES